LVVSGISGREHGAAVRATAQQRLAASKADLGDAEPMRGMES
jgi:hypothetical protein